MRNYVFHLRQKLASHVRLISLMGVGAAEAVW